MNQMPDDKQEIYIKLPPIDTIEDKTKVLNTLLEEVYLLAPKNFIKAIIELERTFLCK